MKNKEHVKEEVKSFSKMLKGSPNDSPTSERRDEGE